MIRPSLFRVRLATLILATLILGAVISLGLSGAPSGSVFPSALAQSPSPSAEPTPPPASTAPATSPSPSPTAPPAAAGNPPADGGQIDKNQADKNQVDSGQAKTADPFGEELTLEPKKVLIVKGSANWDSAFDTLMDSFKTLSTFLDKQGVKPAGNPMIVYTATDDSGFTYLAEIPIDQEPKNLPKDMSIGKSPEGKALKFVHRGSYDNMDNTYEAITNHLDDKKLEAKDTFVEEYITDPLTTNEDKLVINVYVPLK